MKFGVQLGEMLLIQLLSVAKGAKGAKGAKEGT